MAVKSPSDLERSPVFMTKANPEPPVSKAMEHLVTEKGDKLELMANIKSQAMVNALSIGYIYSNVYGSKYVKGRIDQMLRASVGADGEGRHSVISVVEAGGNLPAEYYNPQDNRRYGILANNSEGSNE